LQVWGRGEEGEEAVVQARDSYTVEAGDRGLDVRHCAIVGRKRSDLNRTTATYLKKSEKSEIVYLKQ
jgi:hypothetical protein